MEKEVQADVNATTGLAHANNHMAIALYKLFGKDEGNVFFSPISISCNMAMLFQGARRQAAAELKTALGYEAADIKDENIGFSFENFLKSVESDEGYVFNCANSLLVQKDFSVKESYLDTVRERFDALVLEVDFLRESSKVVSQINEWVAEKTNQMIPRLIEDLDPATVLVILNAVYFKGKWMEVFDEARTAPQLFYNKGLDKCAKHVPMMHITEYFELATNDSYSALVLPYVGKNMAMMLMLPHAKNGLPNLESHLSPSFFEEIRKSMKVCKVDVALPRFRLEYQKSLKEAFQAMGVKNIFRKGAELGAMSDSRTLAVSQIVHKAVVEVNEEGSTAAAGTLSMLDDRCENPTFVVDHPFLFTIFDTRSNLQLFMGKVEDLR